MAAYYNEFDPKAAAWLRELIKQGHIAPGEVDERDIWDVRPDDLRGFVQCHFFAGIGVWSYALRRAGWEDDRHVWTASFPCQPFSAAGKRGGFADERHCWPAGFHLIRECEPRVLFGEQVSSKDGLAWFDVVSADLDHEGYTCWAVDTCAAGFGAPHIRQRLYWCADAERGTSERFGLNMGEAETGTQGEAWEWVRAELGTSRADVHGGTDSMPAGRTEGRPIAGSGPASGGSGAVHGGGDSGCQNGSRWSRIEPGGPDTESGTRESDDLGERSAALFRRGDSDGRDTRPEGVQRSREHGLLALDSRSVPPGLTSGFWADAEWLLCRDGKYRPTKPGLFPLASRAPGRVGRLRGYGNALNAAQAQAFIEAYREVRYMREAA